MERARARAKNVSEKLARPENVVARDKLGFSLGLVLVIFTEYIFLQQVVPYHLPSRNPSLQ
jgi:hypothetical protein